MTAGDTLQLREYGSKILRGSAGEYVLWLDSMTLEQFERHVELPARGVQRECANEAGDRVGNSGGIRKRLRHLSIAAGKDLCGKRKQRRGCFWP